MDNKKIILISGVLLIFISIISAYAYDFNSENEKREILLDETNESDLLDAVQLPVSLMEMIVFLHLEEMHVMKLISILKRLIGMEKKL